MNMVLLLLWTGYWTAMMSMVLDWQHCWEVMAVAAGSVLCYLQQQS